MKKKLIVTLMALSLSVMMFGCGTDAETGKDANSTTNVEGTTKPTSTPTEAPTPTTKPTETPTPTPTPKPTETPTPTPEVTSSFEDAVVGKYWLEVWYGGQNGYYFDNNGKVIIGNSEGQRECPYSLEEDNWVNIDGVSYHYSLWDGMLSLATPPEEGFAYEEITKEEFDSLFK